MTEKTPKYDAEYYIGSFNPSDNQKVADIKADAKNLIDVIQTHCPYGRRSSAACTQIEQAAMIAVKSLFAGA